MAAGAIASTGAEVDPTMLLAQLEAKLGPLEEQANRLREVAQKLDPAEVRESASTLLASASRLMEEFSAAQASDACKGAMASRAGALAARATKARDQARQTFNVSNLKVSRAMERLRVQVSLAIHGHLAPKKVHTDDLFEIADADKDGYVSREEFLTLAEDCRGRETFTEADLKKLFAFVDEQKDGLLRKEDFRRALRVFYRVSRPKVELYQTMGVSQGKKLRGLDIDEVVELVEGPVKESNGVVRIRCRAVRDGEQGWTVEKGDTGTPFLSQSKVHYKVIKQISMTSSFELASARTIRKLEINELLEVQDWEQVERKSGMKRLRAKANTDGAVGWVTTVTNTGEKHLEIV
eukprot:TRINITY_DN16564_c0_g1_i1.p1 TRINITY_DN16564_c0_g1~~TRINITY_DN16564_c0_g1_i1.p1  ORF type:complete len:371 (+),score=75.02 TRINITY_DN16564_c0_g1_i1:62-1114(+)